MPTIIRPITDLRNTNEISELCHSQQEPVFITKNGHGDLVIMSMATYDRNMALLELYRKLHEAEALESSGVKNIDGKEVFEQLRATHGQKTV